MKKLVIVLSLCFAVTAFAAAESGFFVTPEAELQVGIGNYFRGAAVGCQAIFDIGGIGAGIEAKFDYDSGFSNPNVPLFVVLSFTPSFYLMAGQTFGFGVPILDGGDGTRLNYVYGALPNTFGLGCKVLRLDIGFAKLAIGTEIFYTVMRSTETDETTALVGNLYSMFAGLKANVYGGLEFKF
jgi:hypothetical protein